MLVVVLVGVGVVAYQGLTSASLYFYNADEAVEQRDDLGDKRIRIQGTVLDDVEPPTADGVAFTIEFNGETSRSCTTAIRPSSSSPGIPVVLEGHWSPTADALHERQDPREARRAVRGRQR